MPSAIVIYVGPAKTHSNGAHKFFPNKPELITDPAVIRYCTMNNREFKVEIKERIILNAQPQIEDQGLVSD